MAVEVDLRPGEPVELPPLTERPTLSEFLDCVGKSVESMRQQQVDEILYDPILRPCARDELTKLDFDTEARIETSALTESVRVKVSVEFTSEAVVKEDVVRGALHGQ